MQIQVEFEPFGRQAAVPAGTTVAEAAARAGLPIEAPCGAQGVCGKCRVRVVSGALPPAPPDRRVFSPGELREGWRLACQTPLLNDARIYLPDTSLFGGIHQILSSASVEDAAEVHPDVRKAYVALREPTLFDSAPDFERLQTVLLEYGIACREISLPMLRVLPRRLRENGFAGTATVMDGVLIDFEPGDTAAACYGVAVDIGTTTLAASLIDLVSGRELAVASRMNPQTLHGDDVLARIVYAGGGPDALATLHRALLDEIESMVSALCAQVRTRRNAIYEIAFAGNTAMQHLLCGIDPAPLGVVPFVSAFGAGLRRPAKELGLDIHPGAQAYVFPVIGGFVGGDTVAGLLTSQLASIAGPVLFLDLGTNGEIVLQYQGQLHAASTAAGPAFEGARISCGMRGAHGAIERVSAAGDIELGVIGGGKPAGICGSGLVDAAALLLHLGILTPQGGMLMREAAPENLPEAIRARMAPESGEEPAFTLYEDESANRPLRLTQKDIRELQLAAGAIRAGIAILLKQNGLTAEALAGVYIAGGFGGYLRRENALRIGLFPPGVPPERIRCIGNTSLCGAKWAVLSREAREKADLLAFQAFHVDLSRDPDFAMEFAMAMQFPEA